MQTIQEKQNDMMGHYNLFSNQPAAFIKTMRPPKPQKTEIKIVFQHPNLLYLSDKRVKTKQEISEEVEKRLLQLIKNRLKNKEQPKKTSRPFTSYFNYIQNQTELGIKEQPFRCMTSAQPFRRKQKRQKRELQSYTHNYPLQEGIFPLEHQGFLEEQKQENVNRQKHYSSNKSFFKLKKPCSEPKLNMYIEMERKIFNYKNKTKQPTMKKSKI